MSLENLKIETNPQFDKIFFNHLPSKKHNDGLIIIKTVEDFILLPNERKIINLQFKVSVDDNHVMMITNDEQLAKQNGIVVLSRFIKKSNDYIIITLWNTTSVKYIAKVGDVIANAYLLSSPFNFEIQKVIKI